MDGMEKTGDSQQANNKQDMKKLILRARVHRLCSRRAVCVFRVFHLHTRNQWQTCEKKMQYLSHFVTSSPHIVEVDKNAVTLFTEEGHEGFSASKGGHERTVLEPPKDSKKNHFTERVVSQNIINEHMVALLILKTHQLLQFAHFSPNVTEIKLAHRHTVLVYWDTEPTFMLVNVGSVSRVFPAM